jgi:tRNA dimethylallyltransferase
MIPVLIGPTAIGKSAVAIELAKQIDGEIISCDSRQIYKHMDIATAKPTPKEQKEVLHHIIDIIEPNEEYSAARWVDDFITSVEIVRKRNKKPLICGGTFFYINALRDGFDISSSQNAELREEFIDISKKYGNEELYKILTKKNPVRAALLHPNDTYRVVRALQIENDDRVILKKSEEKFMLFVLSCPRDVLYKRINERVDSMVKNGLLDEYKFICKKYPDKNVPGRNCVGYRELDDFVLKEKTFEECVEKIKQHSRNFAKRQITWIRNKEKESFSIDVEKLNWDAQNIAKTIAKTYFTVTKRGK